MECQKVVINTWLLTIKPNGIEKVIYRSETVLSDKNQIVEMQNAELVFTGLSKPDNIVLEGYVFSKVEIVGTNKTVIDYYYPKYINPDSLPHYSTSGKAKILIRESRLINHIVKPSTSVDLQND